MRIEAISLADCFRAKGATRHQVGAEGFEPGPDGRVVHPVTDLDDQPALAFVSPETAATDSQRLMDTSNMSIWEVFGVPRPSETGEYQKVVVEPEGEPEPAPATPKPKSPRAKKPVAIVPPTPAVAPASPPIPFTTGSGLRSQMRRRLVRLRPHT